MYLNRAKRRICVIAIGSFADPSFPAPTIAVWEESRHPWVASCALILGSASPALIAWLTLSMISV
jgi:hypothetical protein